MTGCSVGAVRSKIKRSGSSDACQTTRTGQPVEIQRIIRRMRGGSQARLVQAADGNYYVAKFSGNPQGDRTLVNEWIAQAILSELKIPTPRLRILRLPEELRGEELYFDLGNKRIPVESEYHLGSLCPANPEKRAIFDFLPRRLLHSVINLDDFGRLFGVDRWICQTDTRQAIFVRDQGLVNGRAKFHAYFIDNGLAFAGPEWALREFNSRQAMYFDKSIYSLFDTNALWEKTLTQIEALPEQQVLSPLATLPDYWLSPGDRELLFRLMEGLLRRRRGLRRMVATQIATLLG